MSHSFRTVLVMPCLLAIGSSALADSSITASYFADSESGREYGVSGAVDTDDFGFAVGLYRSRYEQAVPLATGELAIGEADGTRLNASGYKVFGNWELTASASSADSDDGIENREYALGAAYTGLRWMAAANVLAATLESTLLVERSIGQFSTTQLVDESRDGRGLSVEFGYFLSEQWFAVAGARRMSYDDADGLVSRSRFVTNTPLNDAQRPRESAYSLGATRLGRCADWSLDYAVDETVDDGERTRTLSTSLAIPVRERLRFVVTLGRSDADDAESSSFGGIDLVIKRP